MTEIVQVVFGLIYGIIALIIGLCIVGIGVITLFGKNDTKEYNN